MVSGSTAPSGDVRPLSKGDGWRDIDDDAVDGLPWGREQTANGEGRDAACADAASDDGRVDGEEGIDDSEEGGSCWPPSDDCMLAVKPSVLPNGSRNGASMGREGRQGAEV